MLRNYLIIAWRGFKRNKAFSFINISGLATGIASCLVILLFIFDELSYDRFHEKADRIVRVVFRASINGEPIKEAHVMPPVARALKADFPEVQDATRLRMAGSPVVSVGEKSLMVKSMAYADSNFFRVFTLPFVAGNARTALAEPNHVVITQVTAEKFFGTENPIGKILTIKSWNNVSFKISGVMKDIPLNSHFHPDILVSMNSLPESKSDSWMTSEFFTYLVLPKGYDYKKLEAKLPALLKKNVGPQLKQAMGLTYDQFEKSGSKLGLYLQPLTDIHLKSDFAYDIGTAGDIRYVYIFSVIAIFILVIACINFMNLSTAGASKRAKEVGIRKVLGSLKQSLVGQFMAESFLFTTISLVISIVIAICVLPLFNDIIGKDLDLNWYDARWIVPGLLIIGLIVGLFAGSYPAFFLSSFQPIAVLKGKFAAGPQSLGLRSGLVVFQFFISITLIMGTIVVYSQLQFIRNKKLGFDKEQLIVVEDTWRLGNSEQSFIKGISSDPRIGSATVSGYLPAGGSYNNNYTVHPEGDESMLVKTLRYDVDFQYLKTMGMRLAAGRFFSEEFGTDSSAIVINQSTARALGWQENPLGKRLINSDNEGHRKIYTIIGVVKDFHFKSLHQKIAPLVMTLGNNNGSVILKAKTKDIAGLIGSLKKQWDSFNPEAPLTYSFMDERVQQAYQYEQKVSKVLTIFACLTIFIACLGLFGLARFSIEQRTKEIGIRKILGASVAIILNLIAKDFLKLVIIASVVALPVSWYVMNFWLQDYEYRINIQWWMVASPGIFAVLISLATISFEAIKSAVTNPVKSLRSE